jgi:hypothetical protein
LTASGIPRLVRAQKVRTLSIWKQLFIVLLLRTTFGSLIPWAYSTTWPPLDLQSSTPITETKPYKTESDEQ